MALRILIGFNRPGQRGTARAVYVGDSGTDLAAARAAATDASFLILNNPHGIRKSGTAPVVSEPAEIVEEAPAAPVQETLDVPVEETLPPESEAQASEEAPAPKSKGKK